MKLDSPKVRLSYTDKLRPPAHDNRMYWDSRATLSAPLKLCLVAVWGSAVAVTVVPSVSTGRSFSSPFDTSPVPIMGKNKTVTGNHCPGHYSEKYRPPDKGDWGAGRCVPVFSEKVVARFKALVICLHHWRALDVVERLLQGLWCFWRGR